VSQGETPYLAPHVQLLMKSKNVRDKDRLDAEAVIPALSTQQHSWLAHHLSPGPPVAADPAPDRCH
jgi:hypothetical protein